MTDSEIRELLSDYERYHLPAGLIAHHFAMGLIKAGDPAFLLRVPEPFRSQVVELGMEVRDQWHSISSNGSVDHSEHSPKLHSLVVKFLETAPVGQYLRWKT